MKLLVLILSLVIGDWMLSPIPEAEARSWSSQSHKASKSHKSSKFKNGKQPGTSVPELDPSAAGSAMVLLLGGAAYIASRRRKQDLV